MTISTKEKYTAAAFKTVAKFRDEHKISKDDTEFLVELAKSFQKRGIMVENPAGHMVPIIIKTASHNKLSEHKINPLGDARFYQAYLDKKAKKAKGAVK